MYTTAVDYIGLLRDAVGYYTSVYTERNAESARGVE
jgi:hypothetical protein